MYHTDEDCPKMWISEAAEYLGVSVSTLRRWDKIGSLKAKRYASNRRYYLKEELDNFISRGNNYNFAFFKDLINPKTRKDILKYNSNSPLIELLQKYDFSKLCIEFICKITTNPPKERKSRNYFFKRKLLKKSENHLEALFALITAHHCLTNNKNLEFISITEEDYKHPPERNTILDDFRTIVKDANDYCNSWWDSNRKENTNIDDFWSFLYGNPTSGFSSSGKFLILDQKSYYYSYPKTIDFFLVAEIPQNI